MIPLPPYQLSQGYHVRKAASGKVWGILERLLPYSKARKCLTIVEGRSNGD